MSYQTSYDPVSMRWSLSDGSHYLELPEWARELLMDEHERETKPLKNENSKLRELVRDMYEMAYPEYPSAFDAAFSDRMRELGIEVDR